MAYLIRATAARRIYLIVGIRSASTYVERSFIVGISSIKGIVNIAFIATLEGRRSLGCHTVYAKNILCIICFNNVNVERQMRFIDSRSRLVQKL